MKLTESEIEVIHKAMELIATSDIRFTCHALLVANGLPVYKESYLTIEYLKFYESSSKDLAQQIQNLSPITTEGYSNFYNLRQEHRLMMLAWFAEVGPEGLE